MYSLGGTALLRLPSDARLEVRNAGPGLSSLRCCCVALPFFSLDLVHLLFASYKMFPLVVSFFQNKQRSGHKEINAVLPEPEAQGVFYNLGKRFHGEDMGICILAWRIPWTEEPGGLHSMGSQRVRHSLATKPPPGVPSHVFLGRNSPTQVAF